VNQWHPSGYEKDISLRRSFVAEYRLLGTGRSTFFSERAAATTASAATARAVRAISLFHAIKALTQVADEVCPHVGLEHHPIPSAEVCLLRATV